MPDDADRSAEELLRTHPEPDPASGPRAEYEAQRARWAQLRDKQGNVFDPAIHATHPGGAPKRNRQTGLLQLKRGVKPGQPMGATRAAREVGTGSRVGELPPTPPDPGAPGARPPGPSREHYQVAAVVVQSVVLFAVTLGGEEWKTRKMKVGKVTVDEADQLIEAVAAYCQERGYSNLPPEWGLVAAGVAYVGPRLIPRFRGAGGFRGTVNRVRKWRGRGARADRGADGDGEDDPSRRPVLPN